jgi:hypothetical protein
MIHCTEKCEIPGYDKKPDNKTLIGFSTYNISLRLYERLELQKGRGTASEFKPHNNNNNNNRLEPNKTTTTTKLHWHLKTLWQKIN